MSRHGHVVANPDGTKAKCGGPAICSKCAKEKSLVESLNARLGPIGVFVGTEKWRAPETPTEPKVMNCEHGYKIGEKCPGCEHYDLKALRAELEAIDATLGNRSAFDEFKTRVDKVGHAIRTAARADKAEAALARVQAEVWELKRQLGLTDEILALEKAKLEAVTRERDEANEALRKRQAEGVLLVEQITEDTKRLGWIAGQMVQREAEAGALRAAIESALAAYQMSDYPENKPGFAADRLRYGLRLALSADAGRAVLEALEAAREALGCIELRDHDIDCRQPSPDCQPCIVAEALAKLNALKGAR